MLEISYSVSFGISVEQTLIMRNIFCREEIISFARKKSLKWFNIFNSNLSMRGETYLRSLPVYPAARILPISYSVRQIYKRGTILIKNTLNLFKRTLYR